MFEVVCFGSAMVDVMVKSKDFKVMKSHQVSGGVALCEIYGGKTDVDSILMGMGGGATNAAISFRRKGITAAPVVKIATDLSGIFLNDKFLQAKLGTELVVRTDLGQTGMSIILVAPDGGRSILTYRGVSATLESREIDWDRLKGTRWFYISSLGGRMDLLEDILAFAGKESIKVALNPGRLELAHSSRLKLLLKKANVLFLNRLELVKLTGVDFDDKTTLFKATSLLGCPLVIMTEGKLGSVAITGGQTIQADAFRVNSVDDTGAGDAFGSGVIYGLLTGQPLDIALKIGAANGASQVTQIGAQTGLLTEGELQSWLKRPLNIVETNLKA